MTGAALRACVWAALAAAPFSAYAQIYAGTSPQSGALILSSFASNDTSVLLIPARPEVATAVAPVSSRPPGARKVVSAELQRIVDSAASRSAISAQLIHAVIETESQYEPKAVSTRGAIGLMQLLPSTAKRFGAQDPFDPGQNVSAGAAYLKWLMGYFGDDLELVLAGYNAGEQAVVRAGRKIPPYAETQAYVKKVMATLQRATPAPL
jgi:soluble lytic murein transglycosylase-like protein